MAGSAAEWCGTKPAAVTGTSWAEPGIPTPVSTSSRVRHRLSCAWRAPDFAASGTPPLCPSKLRRTTPDTARLCQGEACVRRGFRHLQGDLPLRPHALNAKVESVSQDSPDWRKERSPSTQLTEGADGGLPVHACARAPALPDRRVLPSARVLFLPAGAALGDMQFIDFVIQSGRAVLYPCIRGPTKRAAAPPGPIRPLAAKP